jgi:hypothetical protein
MERCSQALPWRGRGSAIATAWKVVPDVSNEPRDYNQPIPEPDDPRDLSMPPPVTRPAANEGDFRNGMATIGMYIGITALVLEVLVGTPILLFLSLVALGMGLIGWARLHRKQANNGRTVLLCILVSLLAVGVGIFWGSKTGDCAFVDSQKQQACIKDNAGLL